MVLLDYSGVGRSGGETSEWGLTTVDDNMAAPDRIAETYLQLHRQHRLTWAFVVVLRPWVERW